MKCHFFGDVNVNVHGKRDILTLKALLLEKLKCNYFLFYCLLLFLFAFHTSKFCKIASINFVNVIITKNMVMHCFKRRRHKVVNNLYPAEDMFG